MKKFITLVVLCMMAYALPATAETASGSTGNAAGEVKGAKEHMTPEQRTAKIEERIKKLEEHKAKATSNGKTDIANAVQGLIDALNNLKGVVVSKNRDSIKSAIEQVKTARAALEKLVPAKIKEKCKKAVGDKANKSQGKNSL